MTRIGIVALLGTFVLVAGGRALGFHGGGCGHTGPHPLSYTNAHSCNGCGPKATGAIYGSWATEIWSDDVWGGHHQGRHCGCGHANGNCVHMAYGETTSEPAAADETSAAKPVPAANP